MPEGFQLGALDFCNLEREGDPVDALWQTLDLAPELESIGYSRYWLAEHHTYDVAHSSPEMLLPVLAGMTSRIHVGTAGILLNYYSPFKIATNFRLLNALFPGRIDLGLGRGRVADLIAGLLDERRPARPPYEDKLAELLKYLRGQGETALNPRNVAPPEVWVLGSKTRSAELAAASGTAFCLALFLGHPIDPAEVLGRYRENFRPSPEMPTPKASLALAGVCHENEAEASRLAAERLPEVTPTLVGTPVWCLDHLAALRQGCGTDEFVFLDLCRRFEDRIASHRLLAEILGVRPEATRGAAHG